MTSTIPIGKRHQERQQAQRLIELAYKLKIKLTAAQAKKLTQLRK